MEKVKIGVIGTGHLGRLHTRMINELEDAELSGVFDIDEEKSSVVASEFRTRKFENLEEAFENSDAVSIVTTTSTHYEIAKQALEFGKDVFVEKPITDKIWQAEELVALAKKQKAILQVGHIERFNPALISLERFNLEPMFIQTDRLAQFNPRGTDVAVVLDLMIHDIDIILSLIKSKVKEIRASGVAVVSNNIDIANARIEFENGAVANVTASRISQKKMRKMRMFQRDAYISLDFITGVSEVYRLLPSDNKKPEHFISFGEMGVGENKKMIIYEQPETPEINALKHELALFVKAIRERSRPVVSGEDGLRALKIAEQIIRKIEEVKIV
jgi:predicted dehydrogenase